ncbi:MAG: phosphate ABC transporter substrate-binding protein PstS, partial [Betaproteobacteria bacterium]|nr:phosphate ABC transporter substrate-binding protein PstS [Betaproteobacteria bacterium]
EELAALVKGSNVVFAVTHNYTGYPLVRQARQMIKRLNPDVLTLDIEMPDMDGLSFLEKIIRLRPMPVVMVSTLTQEGADAAIKALNPSLNLPDAAIAPVRRADGSGTTFLFTSYLSKVNAEWKAKVGENSAVNWPVGAGGKGNEGVSAFVARLPNSIGYVEYTYVKQNKLAHVMLQNAAGNFVAPDDTAFKAAAAGADWSKSFNQIITNMPGKDSWPISGATFILMHAKQDNPAKGAETLKFFQWAYQNGDKTASDLEYVPMPKSVVAAIEKLWGEVKDGAGKPVWTK